MNNLSMLSPTTSGFPPSARPSKPVSNATALRCRAALSGDTALRAFRAHHLAGRALDANPALLPALAACAHLPAAAADAEQIHALLVKCGIPRAVSDVHACTSLVRAYARLGRMRDARKVFDGMQVTCIITYKFTLYHVAAKILKYLKVIKFWFEFA